MKQCTKCRQSKTNSEFYVYENSADKLRPWCKECWGKYTDKYQQSKEGRTIHNKANKKYRESIKGKNYFKNYQNTHKEHINELHRNFEKTLKGRINRKRQVARYRQNLNWILMFSNPFADSVLVDYHHITDTYVVAIPRELHQMYSGKYHREKVMDIVKQIYLES